MSVERSGDQIVSDCFLEVRAKILEVAATFDRIDRAKESSSLSESSMHDLKTLQEAAKILTTQLPTRAETLQQLFSRPYREGWRSEYGLDSASD